MNNGSFIDSSGTHIQYCNENEEIISRITHKFVSFNDVK